MKCETCDTELGGSWAVAVRTANGVRYYCGKHTPMTRVEAELSVVPLDSKGFVLPVIFNKTARIEVPQTACNDEFEVGLKHTNL